MSLYKETNLSPNRKKKDSKTEYSYNEYSEEIKACLKLQAGDYSYLNYFQKIYKKTGIGGYRRYVKARWVDIQNQRQISLSEYMDTCYTQALLDSISSVDLERLKMSSVDLSKWRLGVHFWGYLLRAGTKQITKEKKDFLNHVQFTSFDETYMGESYFQPEESLIKEVERSLLLDAIEKFIYFAFNKKVKLDEISLEEISKKLGVSLATTKKKIKGNKNLFVSCIRSYSPEYQGAVAGWAI